MGLDDRVYTDVNPEPNRNENLEGGKSTASSVDEAKQEKELAGREPKCTEPKRDPDEIKATAELLPSDAERKCDLSAGDSL